MYLLKVNGGMSLNVIHKNNILKQKLLWKVIQLQNIAMTAGKVYLFQIYEKEKRKYFFNI